MNAQIELLENDIKRATAHVKQAIANHWDNPSHNNKRITEMYQNILDKLEIKLEELRG